MLTLPTHPRLPEVLRQLRSIQNDPRAMIRAGGDPAALELALSLRTLRSRSELAIHLADQALQGEGPAGGHPLVEQVQFEGGRACWGPRGDQAPLYPSVRDFGMFVYEVLTLRRCMPQQPRPRQLQALISRELERVILQALDPAHPKHPGDLEQLRDELRSSLRGEWADQPWWRRFLKKPRRPV